MNRAAVTRQQVVVAVEAMLDRAADLDSPVRTPPWPQLQRRYLERLADARAGGEAPAELDETYVGGATARSWDPEIRRLRKAIRRTLEQRAAS